MNENICIYSVIITYCGNGGTRGFTVKAKDRVDAMQKLMNHINFNIVESVQIADIIMDQDNI